jgi:hypothetical protein
MNAKTSMRERIVQFHYQLNRTNTNQEINNIEQTLRDIINEIYSQRKEIEDRFSFSLENKEYLITLYKLIAYTRDIVNGKGERLLSYMMIYVWYTYFPVLAKYALYCFVISPAGYNHPFGSWKDVKYFCNYCIEKGLPKDCEMIRFAICMINEVLLCEENQFYGKIDKGDIQQNQSLVSKWIPREKSAKFGWLFDELAYSFFSIYFDNITTPLQLEQAKRKAKMNYRILISALNKNLNTIQITQCNGLWSSIDHSKTTSITLAKQKQALLNINIKKVEDGKDTKLESKNIDRNICREKFIQHISIQETIKGKRISMCYFVKEALRLICIKETKMQNCGVGVGVWGGHADVDSLVALLNSQWRNNSKYTNELENVIPMVDTSQLLGEVALYSAIGLGIRIAEKSLFGKRLITFSNSAIWYNFDDCDNFVDCVAKIHKTESIGSGVFSNFKMAIDIITESITESSLTKDQVNGLSIVILSDMKIDMYNNCGLSFSIYEKIKMEFENLGIKINGMPYRPPHILCWNLRETSVIPCSSTDKNVTIFTGFNPTLLNVFCKKTFQIYEACNPWKMLMHCLKNPAYTVMENKINEMLV